MSWPDSPTGTHTEKRSLQRLAYCPHYLNNDERALFLCSLFATSVRNCCVLATGYLYRCITSYGLLFCARHMSAIASYMYNRLLVMHKIACYRGVFSMFTGKRSSLSVDLWQDERCLLALSSSLFLLSRRGYYSVTTVARWKWIALD